LASRSTWYSNNHTTVHAASMTSERRCQVGTPASPPARLLAWRAHGASTHHAWVWSRTTSQCLPSSGAKKSTYRKHFTRLLGAGTMFMSASEHNRSERALARDAARFRADGLRLSHPKWRGTLATKKKTADVAVEEAAEAPKRRRGPRAGSENARRGGMAVREKYGP
jgi:hypothetical protein